MRHFARTSLGMLALGLIAPITASAQDSGSTASGSYLPTPMPSTAPATPATSPAPGSSVESATYQPLAPGGYQPASSVPPSAAAPTAPAPMHVHKRGKTCAACAAKMANSEPPGKIVGCAHSKNGVCTACQAALNQPGPWVQAGAGPAVAAAPGRAVAASGMPAGMNGYDPSMADPAPVGVVQAGYSQSAGMMPMQAPMASGMPANAPGRAVAESTPGRDPYQRKTGSFPHPHILGHLFGWSGIGAERREERAFKKSEAHAMMTYDPNAPTGVSELPASQVFGKQK